MRFYLKNDGGEFYEVFKTKREAEKKYETLKRLLAISENEWVSGVPAFSFYIFLFY